MTLYKLEIYLQFEKCFGRLAAGWHEILKVVLTVLLQYLIIIKRKSVSGAEAKKCQNWARFISITTSGPVVFTRRLIDF